MDYDFDLTQAQYLPNAKLIAGVDEVGRGPWAGPVTACACILNPENIPDGLNDSKKISPAKRETIYEQLVETAQFKIVHIEVSEIDRLNILQASLLAMRKSIEGLPQNPDLALIDGNKIPADLSCPARAIVKGDGKSPSIAAASIIAKVTRDRLMESLAQQFPGYGWESNKGYGTKMHQIGLRNLGVTTHHRKSFKPIHKILCEEESVTN